MKNVSTIVAIRGALFREPELRAGEAISTEVAVGNLKRVGGELCPQMGYRSAVNTPLFDRVSTEEEKKGE